MRFIARKFLSPDSDGGGEGAKGGQGQSIDFTAHEAAAIEHLKTKGYIVETKEGSQKTIDEVVRKGHESWEEAIATELGIEKPAGVGKGIDWAKSAVRTLKDKANSSAPNPPDPTKPDPKSVDADKDKAERDALRKELDDFKKGQADARKADEEKSLNISLRSAVKSIAFNTETDEDAVTRRNTAEKLIKADYDVKFGSDNELVYYEKGTDKVVIDPDTQQAITTDKLVAKEYKFLIGSAKEQPKGGTGTQRQQPVVKEVNGVKVFTATSLNSLREQMRAAGLTAGSKEYTDSWFDSCKQNRLDPQAFE